MSNYDGGGFVSLSDWVDLMSNRMVVSKHGTEKKGWIAWCFLA
jgi:hypothetical protein